MTNTMTNKNLAVAREWVDQEWEPKDTLIDGYETDVESGWLFPLLLKLDSFIWGRWDYWGQMALDGCIGTAPIPQIEFENVPHPKVMKMLNNCIQNVGSGVSQYTAMEYFLDWLLYGFGKSVVRPKEPEPGAFDRIYQLFCLDAILAFPFDYLGHLFSEQQHGKYSAFFPTPLSVCLLMAGITYDEGVDNRTKTCYDPAVGTGRTLLLASNHCLRLSGQEIDILIHKACEINMWFYAP